MPPPPNGDALDAAELLTGDESYEPLPTIEVPVEEVALQDADGDLPVVEATLEGSGSDIAPDESVLLAEASLSDPAKAHFEATEPLRPTSDPGWRRLARSLSHEIRNPLVSIRSFAELLPDHFEDETFRERFVELVGRDVDHIDDVVTRLQTVAEHEKSELEAVDLSAMIEVLLEERRERIQAGRLLVLRELERESPLAWADPVAIRVALAGLLDRALDSLPERGDLFVATRRIERGADGEPHLRILLRHHGPRPGQPTDDVLAELSREANVLEYVLAETVVEACGGRLTIDTSDAAETLILVDLRTPA
jgi:K+-sensing histidine kinase KdpD